MTTKIFVNLPVKDLQRSIDFFTTLGYGFNKQFTDANATCMIVTDDIYVMLLVQPFFQSFLPKGQTIADAKATEVLTCLMLESRAEVDGLVDKAIAAGASIPEEAQDHGFMYARSYQDLDGHFWNIAWMDPNYVQKPA